MAVVSHYVGGKAFAGSSKRTAPVYDPALGTVSKEVALASAADLDKAVAVATAAFPAWRDLSVAKRQSVMFRFRELLEAKKSELAAIITAEHGKVLSDAMGEIQRGQEVVEFACALGHLMKGEYS
jgi:malonate-semialdehyde dehydrogenase (acetylating)/methylmalonate-semialdehyde dehydrogenase